MVIKRWKQAGRILVPEYSMMPRMMERRKLFRGNTKHKYYRMYITGLKGGGSSTDIAHIYELISYADTDLSGNQLTGATATASGYDGVFEPGRAIDGNFVTGWRSPGSSIGSLPQWIQFELSSGITSGLLAIYPYSPDLTQAPTIFDWQYSDNAVSFTNIYSSNKDISYDTVGPFYIPVYCNAWRVRVSAVQNGGDAVLISEIKPRDSGGASLLSGVQYLAYANDRQSTAANPYDGSSSTTWQGITTFASGFTKFNGFILPMGVSINPYDFQITSGSVAGQSPVNFVIEDWNYLTGWTVRKTVSGISWSTFETKTFVL